MKAWYLVIIAGLLCPLPAAGHECTLAPSPEELAWMEIPQVVTAARKLQPITRAPASVSVITAEEIRQSGLTTIPDILRRLAGVEVMELTPSDISVGIRGMNAPESNKILVMIDGRSVYMDFYGTTFWSTLPVVLEEIERIEVVRGPGSALYGANAFSGVINIITKSPDQLEGARVSAGAGTRSTYLGSAIYAGREGDIGYKLALGWNQQGLWEDHRRSALANLVVNGRVDYDLTEERKLGLSAGINTGKDKIVIDETQGQIQLDGYHSFLRLDYIQPDLNLFTYWNRGDADFDSRLTGRETSYLYNTYHTELQNSFDLTPGSAITWGGSYRYNDMESPDIERDREQNLYSLFLQGDVILRENLNLVLGGRYDYNSLISDQRLSPRGSLVYQIHPDHTLRLSVGKAHRDPTFLEAFVDFQGIYDPANPELTWHLRGNRNLKPEKILAYEIGWMANLTPLVKTRLDLFYNDIEDLIGTEVVSRYPFPPYPPRDFTFLNSAHRVRAIGGEAGAEFMLTGWLTGFVNYSYQELRDRETRKIIRSAPRNKFNAGLEASTGQGLSGTLVAHYVDRTDWVIGETGEEKGDEYTLVNARVAYALVRPDLEFAFSVFNLLDDRHREHPLGEKIGQRFLFTARYSF